MSMDEPQPDAPEGFADRGILDRSQQAARFLDLTRQHGLVDDDDDDVLPPLVATRLEGIIAARRLRADATDDDDDISIDPSAFGAMRPGSIDPGSGLGSFSLDDDGDVFGDGNGFGSGTGFGPDVD